MLAFCLFKLCTCRICGTWAYIVYDAFCHPAKIYEVAINDHVSQIVIPIRNMSKADMRNRLIKHGKLTTKLVFICSLYGLDMNSNGRIIEVTSFINKKQLWKSYTQEGTQGIDQFQIDFDKKHFFLPP